MNLRNVLVTGGTGFIGTGVCRRLLQDGVHVNVLTRDVSRARATLPRDVNLLTDLNSLEPVEGIINLAGAPLADRRWNKKRKQVFYSSRVGLTQTLFQHYADKSIPAPKVLISGSAIGYYGPRGEEDITESAAPGNGFSSRLCRDWEAAASRFESFGTRVCLLRTGIVLGAQGGALKAMLPPFRLGLGGPIGSGEQWMPWIHRDDMVNIICTALADDRFRGAVNAVAPTPVKNKAFSRTLANVLSRPALLPMPAFIVRALFGEMAEELLLTGQKVIPAKLLDHHFEFTYAELESALRSILNRH